MKAKLEVNSMKTSQKYIDAEAAQQSIKFNKEMLRTLNERALSRAYQLDRFRA